MKSLITLILLSLTVSASALPTNDSVAVFHRPEKVIIQVNEGYEGYSRLSDMMDFLDVGNRFQATSSDQSIVISCGRNYEAASCIFKFLPSNEVKITPKKLSARTTLSNLKLNAEGAFVFSFHSSMEDKFMLKIIDGVIFFEASKKVIKQ